MCTSLNGKEKQTDKYTVVWCVHAALLRTIYHVETAAGL